MSSLSERQRDVGKCAPTLRTGDLFGLLRLEDDERVERVEPDRLLARADALY